MSDKPCKRCGKSQGGYENGGNLCRSCYNADSREKMRIKRGTPPEKFRDTAEDRKFPMGTCFDCGEAIYLNSRCQLHYNAFARRYQKKPKTTCNVCGLPREAGSRRVLCLAHRRASEAAAQAMRSPPAKKIRVAAVRPVRVARVAPPIVYVGQRQEEAEKKPAVVGPEEFMLPTFVVVGDVKITKCPPAPDAYWAERCAGRLAAVGQAASGPMVLLVPFVRGGGGW